MKPSRAFTASTKDTCGTGLRHRFGTRLIETLVEQLKSNYRAAGFVAGCARGVLAIAANGEAVISAGPGDKTPES